MAMNGYQNNYAGHEEGYRKRCTKTDWAGVSIGDAFKPNVDYYLRIEAQRKFYQAVKKVQMALAKQAGTADPGPPRVKPQISPFYTNYPSPLSAYAAIGLTGYLEFEARVREKILFTHMANYLKNPAQHDKVKVSPEIYRRMAIIVTKYVQTRLLLEDLSRLSSASSVEVYRLFCASQKSMRFRSVPEIIRAVILYGDILPDWGEQELHPMTQAILQDLKTTSLLFFDSLPHLPPRGFLIVGNIWVRAVCRCLSKYLPDSEAPKNAPAQKPQPLSRLPEFLHQINQGEYKFKEESKQKPLEDKVAPMNCPRPPSLFDPANPIEQIASSFLNKEQNKAEKSLSASNLEAINKSSSHQTLLNFVRAVDKAGSQQRNWEDMRSDILEKILRASDFSPSPIQGNPTDGHEVAIQLGDGRSGRGEIFDRPLELSDDFPAYEKLLDEARPITNTLKQALYPNLEQVPETERFCASGSLDPGRLAIADVSTAIFRRYCIHQKADRRGRPLLLIACDGSGSLKENQINMLKVLTAAWLNSTAKSSVQVMAGLYHSGQIRPGLAGPLVQWIYHPQKTPATSRREAARTLLSLPRAGTGTQADALSLAFMLNEAYQLAKGRMVYLILITDCKWNRSFPMGKAGREEVYSCFQDAYNKFSDRLHTTLVALGVCGQTGFDDILDKVITVSNEEFGDYGKVAVKIGLYVASCMRKRHKRLACH